MKINAGGRILLETGKPGMVDLVAV